MQTQFKITHRGKQLKVMMVNGTITINDPATLHTVVRQTGSPITVWSRLRHTLGELDKTEKEQHA